VTVLASAAPSILVAVVPTLLPALLASAAVAVLLRRPSSAARLARAGLPGSRPGSATRAVTGPAGRGSPRPPWTASGSHRTAVPGRSPVLPLPAGGGPAFASPVGPRVACGAAALALALVVGGPAGVVLAALLAVAGPRLLGRLEPSAVRAERERLVVEMPMVLDLLAACLAGGATLAAAVLAVAAADPGPSGDRLRRVAAALSVGTPPAEAWTALGTEPEELAAVSRAFRRADEGGAPVADVVARLASEQRAEAQARAVRAAKRVGVLAVAPLGLCFLPAFVLLGVVPVVAGLVGPVLSGL
jgi:Type II secretion system (T2SS), protein F